MAAAKRTKEILAILDGRYGTVFKSYLDYRNAFELLIATMLAAQCTDARVNIVTKDLYRKYPDPAAFAAADLKELERDIHSTGFYHNKAKNIIACSKMIMEKHGGQVPKTLEELTALPGVGRKTANVIRGNVYREPSIVVDTHVKRISWRLGMTEETDPVKVEMDLMKKLPKDHWILWNLQIIAHGRSICMAQRPLCGECPLWDYCRDGKKHERKTAAKPEGKAEL